MMKYLLLTFTLVCTFVGLSQDAEHTLKEYELHGAVKEVTEDVYLIKQGTTDFIHDETRILQFSKSGKLTNQDDLYWIYKYSYDSSDRLISLAMNHKAEEQQSMVTFSYDEDNHVVKEVGKSSYFGYSEENFTYNELGQMVKRVTEGEQMGEGVFATTNYTYHANGKIAHEEQNYDGEWERTIHYTYPDEYTTITTIETPVWGKKGETETNPLKTETIDEKGFRNSFLWKGEMHYYAYDFDSKGNWIKKVSYTLDQEGNKIPNGKIERKITYYD